MTDVFTIALAGGILAIVIRWSGRARPATAFFLALLTGVWIWANLRNPGWQEVVNQTPPDGLDPVTNAMYWRGWPLAPVMLCLMHGNRIRPGGPEGLALVFDWLVLFATLSLGRFAFERCTRPAENLRRRASSREE